MKLQNVQIVHSFWQRRWKIISSASWQNTWRDALLEWERSWPQVYFLILLYDSNSVCRL